MRCACTLTVARPAGAHHHELAGGGCVGDLRPVRPRRRRALFATHISPPLPRFRKANLPTTLSLQRVAAFLCIVLALSHVSAAAVQLIVTDTAFWSEGINLGVMAACQLVMLLVVYINMRDLELQLDNVFEFDTGVSRKGQVTVISADSHSARARHTVREDVLAFRALFWKSLVRVVPRAICNMQGCHSLQPAPHRPLCSFSAAWRAGACGSPPHRWAARPARRLTNGADPPQQHCAIVKYSLATLRMRRRLAGPSSQ